MGGMGGMIYGGEARGGGGMADRSVGKGAHTDATAFFRTRPPNLNEN